MKIYLATPYSDPNEDIREKRFKKINQIAASIMRDYGFHVFSPISHTHPIAKDGDLPNDFDFWEEYDRVFIEWADEIWVYKSPGWKESIGVSAEIKLAKSMGKPVSFIECEEDNI